ncbi:hypothetical protein OQY15_09875 [Pedobacter sp. MC2016-15]|jgi:MFS superfamily sulfate permease-like transporter|uniref:Uncharacterized protein n=1 Tax=Pedobacter westerhofensis TaxID=425512 RepID=A0A521DQQ6_9SPHI|nr:hypothetical protein [Pedobacter sp. BAL39]MCX2479397.1 hypothetical protein [Pedobacter sp. MC2016-15]SMO73932.1 hypothetical protein SAMN06265348_10698 [Pedobacter westerhofensis]
MLTVIGILSSYSCHSSAFFRTSLTSICTFLTMLGMMITTLISALLANICANTANVLSKRATHTHQLSGRVADGCTLHIKLNTPRHHFHVFFLSA